MEPMSELATPRQTPRHVLAMALAIAVLAGTLYGSGLDVAPLYVTKDEASYGIQSHAVATTGRDTNGRFLPVFFQEQGFPIGRDPLYIYASALVLQFTPMSGGALRVPTVIAAAISIGLVVLIAYELFGSAALAAVAGVLAAVTPVFFIRSRAALAVMVPVPFQLVWLLCLIRYWRAGRLGAIVTGTAALGIGVYSYLNMLFFMPIHMLCSLAEIARQRRWRHAVVVLAVLAALMVPMAAWQMQHPRDTDAMATSYGVYPAGLTPLQGLKDVLAWSSLSRRADIYWNAFNPGRLFFSGESSLIDSTREAGLYPVVYLLLLPLGAYALLKRPLTVVTVAILSVFMLGPVPGTLVGQETIARYLVAGPLAALLAVAAIDWLWRTGWLAARFVAVAAVVISLVLFRGFYVDYMGEWRVRSAIHMGGNLKGAMDHVLAQGSTPDLVYLSERIPYVNVFWEFYKRANSRDDLTGRDRGLSLSQEDWKSPSGRAMAIVPGGDDPTAPALLGAGWTTVAEIREFYGGPPTFLVLSRN